MTQPNEATGPDGAPSTSRLPVPPSDGPGWRGRALAVTLAALTLVGAGVGVGMAATADDSTTMGMAADPDPGATPSAGPHGTGTGTGKTKNKGTHGTHGGTPAVDPARQAWSHKYGVDRSTMPNLAPAASASAAQRAAATDLLERTRAATAQYADLSKAAAAGYDLSVSLARKEKESPKLADQLKRIDAGTAGAAQHMPMLHVGNKAHKTDGKVLDPNAPETLMYSYQGDGKWMLIGVMYTATEMYPQAPPDPGGPITRWHYHDKSGARGLMMHIFFVPGNDLAHAYAAEMS